MRRRLMSWLGSLAMPVRFSVRGIIAWKSIHYHLDVSWYSATHHLIVTSDLQS